MGREDIPKSKGRGAFEALGIDTSEGRIEEGRDEIDNRFPSLGVQSCSDETKTYATIRLQTSSGMCMVCRWVCACGGAYREGGRVWLMESKRSDAGQS